MYHESASTAASVTTKPITRPMVGERLNARDRGIIVCGKHTYTIRHMQSRPRVVVTGVGVVTSIGVGAEAFWRALLAGECGIGPVQSFDTSPYTVHIGGEVTQFNPAPFTRRLRAESLGRASQLAIAAARLALDDAGLEADEMEPRSVGVSLGTTSGEPTLIERFDDCEVENRRQDIGREFIEQYPSH